MKIFKKIYCYKNKDNTLVLEINCKKLIEFIQKTVDKDGLKIKVSKDTERGFIEGLIDSDGYVQRNYCEITTANPKLKDNIVEILNKFGVRCNIRRFPRNHHLDGFRVGFSLNGGNFLPTKWISGVQTAE